MNHDETRLRQRRRKDGLLSSACVDRPHLGFSLGCSVEMQVRKPKIVGIIGGKKKIFIDKMLLKRYWWKTMLEECTKIVRCCLQSEALLEQLKASHFACFLMNPAHLVHLSSLSRQLYFGAFYMLSSQWQADSSMYSPLQTPASYRNSVSSVNLLCIYTDWKQS